MIDPTDAEKARMSKVIGEFDDAWFCLNYFTSRDALWPVLEKLADGGDSEMRFLFHLIGKGVIDLDISEVAQALLHATPAQLALAAAKTIEEMKEEKNETD